jgi:hypothetical protein
MYKKIFILFLILCLLTTIIGCRGAPTVPPISPEPEVSFSEEFVLVQVTDPESNIIFVTGKENEDAIAILGEKDNQGDPTKITGAFYVTEQGDAFYLEAGIDGLPTYVIDSESNTVIFENYTNSTVDVSIYDSNGIPIQGLTTINIDPSDLLEIKQLYNSFYSKQRWSRQNTVDVLKWGAVGLSWVGCISAGGLTVFSGGVLTPTIAFACGKAIFSTLAAITPNDTDNIISIAIGSGSCLISGGADVWGCESTILSIVAWGTGQSVSTTSSLTSTEIELIRKWGFGGDYVVRWPNGYMDVYDATNYSQMQEILNQWNAVIGGPVILRLSSNPNSQVKVYYKLIFGYCGNRDVKWSEDYTFSTIDIQISDNDSCGYPSTKYALYLFMFKNVAGFKGWTTKGEDVPYEEWTNFTEINGTMKKMVKALYKVPPGYYLGDSKQRKDYSNVVIKNISTSEGVNCLDNGKK